MTQSRLNLQEATAVLPVGHSSIGLYSRLVYGEPMPGRLSSWARTSMVVGIAGRDMTRCEAMQGMIIVFASGS